MEAAMESPSMYPPHEHKNYRWGMAINLSSCTGCGACYYCCPEPGAITVERLAPPPKATAQPVPATQEVANAAVV